MIVYAMYNKVNDKCYIGRTTKKTRFRKNQHFSDLRCNRHYNEHMQKDWNEYGEEAFEFVILEKGFKDIDEIDEAEKFWITTLKTTNVESGYNIANGGSNFLLTEEFKNKLRKEQSKTRGKNVYQYDLNGKFIKKYESIRQASRKTGICKQNITGCCKHIKGQRMAGNYMWSFKKEKMEPHNKREKFEKLGRNVLQYDLDGNFIKEYPTLSDASRSIGVTPTTICYGCKNDRPAAGFIWEYKE